jgi:CBS domain-containing protein
MNETTSHRAASRGSDTPVRELMTSPVTTIEEHECAALAQQFMLQSRIRHLPVMRHNALVGILSDRDLIAAAERGSMLATQVRDIMHAPVETIGPDAGVAEASARMATKRISCLPVIAEGRLIGILTSTDILAERGRMAARSSVAPPRSLRARDIMHRRILTIGPELSLLDAMEALIRTEVRHLPVLNAAGRLVGMVSDRELRAAGNPRAALAKGDTRELIQTTVDTVMRPSPSTIGEDASLFEVANAFLDERVTALCVVDSNARLVGIITYVDVLASMVGRKA